MYRIIALNTALNSDTCVLYHVLYGIVWFIALSAVNVVS